MEDMTLDYKGKKIVVHEGSTSGFTFLPAELKDVGNRQIIFEHGLKGFRAYETTKVDESVETTTLELKMNNGIPSYEVIMPDGTISTNQLDLGKTKLDKYEELAKGLYEFKNSYEIKAKTGYSADQIMMIRKFNLKMMMESLGYKMPYRIDEDIQFEEGSLNLRTIGEKLENYKNLAFIRVNKFDSSIIEIDDQAKLDDETITEMTKELAFEIEDGVEKTENEKEYTRRVMGVDKKYINDPQNSMGEDFSIYKSQLQKVAKLILGLNYDLLPEESRDGIEDLTTLQGLELDDKISEVIDDRDFEVACNVEDKYIASENERAEKGINNLLIRNEESPNPIFRALVEIKNKVVESRIKRQDYMKKYDEISKLYNAKMLILKGHDDMDSKRESRRDERE